MDLLQYRSNEMFSSTELIRKSKMVFDKISKKEIDKAVILRDGKPSFMLLDFMKYEELITEYLELKEEKRNRPKITNTQKVKEVDEQKENQDLLKSFDDVEKDDFDEINSDDLQDALAQIEQLDLQLEKKPVIKKEEALKDFWE